jgi:hypothetical protein
MTKTYISDALERINLSGKHAIASFNDGDTLRIMLMGLKRLPNTNLTTLLQQEEELLIS